MTHLSNVALRYTLFLVALASTAYAKNSRVLDFDEGQQEEGVLPSGCQNPFREPIKFLQFFEVAISRMAADRGADARGVADLFAVDALQSKISEGANRRSGEESAMDRLIVTQLCHYEKIATAKMLSAGSKAQPIMSKDPDLQDHLAGIAKKLLADAVELYRAEKRADQKVKNEEEFMRSRRKQIERAKRLGEEKASDLID